MTDIMLQQVPQEATHAQLAEIISMRDYFAMSALGALISEGTVKKIDSSTFPLPELVAGYSYAYADAMLAERVKNEAKS